MTFSLRQPSSSLSSILEQQWEKKPPLHKPPLQLNQASIEVMNSMNLEASFPVKRRPQRRPLSSDPNDYLSHAELLSWASELKIRLGILISTVSVFALQPSASWQEASCVSGWFAAVYNYASTGDLPNSNEEEKARMADRYNWGFIHRELAVRDLVLLHQKESAKLDAR